MRTIQEVTYINESKLCKVAINIMIIKKICLFINRFILNFTRNLIQTEISHNFDCRKLLIPKWIEVYLNEKYAYLCEYCFHINICVDTCVDLYTFTYIYI